MMQTSFPQSRNSAPRLGKKLGMPKALHLGAWLIALVLGVYGFAYAGEPSDTVRALHVLNRLGYGPRPGDLERVKAMGVERYIEEQLHPESIPLPEELKQKLARLDTLSMTPVELFKEYGPPVGRRGQKPDPQEIKARRQRARVILEQAVQARLVRAIESPRQLEETMVDFWFNHFNVFAGKGLDHLWVGAFEEEAIRPYALGRFRDLLEATARHPAMLFYLDNWMNTAPGSPGARGRFEGINENYARELMELHTLGVAGGYTQQDVIALAKILTGWGIGPRNGKGGDEYGFRFDPRRHDYSDKVFLGHTIKGSGEHEVEQALDILASSPATARHVSYELAQYFVADHPDPALVEVLARRYSQTGGDIRAVLETLFHSKQFWDAKNFGNKFKTPYQYVISAIRATGEPVQNVRPIYGMLYQLGMPLYGCPTPDGYKNTRDAWLNPDAMTRRLSFATVLASGRLPLNRPMPEEGLRPAMLKGKMGERTQAMNDARGPAPDSSSRGQAQPVDPGELALTLGNAFSKKTADAVAAAPGQLRAALILGSPEFMQR